MRLILITVEPYLETATPAGTGMTVVFSGEIEDRSDDF
jgi:hypothetical protein